MDRYVVACNYTEGTGVAAPGALCYVSLSNPGGGSDRLLIVVRSRGGRWVQKWENIRRLANFRLKTLPPEHPRYQDQRIQDGSSEWAVGLEQARARHTT